MTKSTLAAKYRSLTVRKSHKQAYLDQHVDCAAMSARKNAPRWIKQLKLIGNWPVPKTAPATASA